MRILGSFKWSCTHCVLTSTSGMAYSDAEPPLSVPCVEAVISFCSFVYILFPLSFPCKARCSTRASQHIIIDLHAHLCNARCPHSLTAQPRRGMSVGA